MKKFDKLIRNIFSKLTKIDYNGTSSTVNQVILHFKMHGCVCEFPELLNENVNGINYIYPLPHDGMSCYLLIILIIIDLWIHAGQFLSTLMLMSICVE